MHLLPGCYLMSWFVLWPTHLLQETASPVQRNRATSGPNFAFFLPASFTGLGLGWAPQAGKARKKLLPRLPKCLLSSTTSQGCLVWKSRSLEWKLATSYSVPPFTDLFLWLPSTKMDLKYDLSLKHLTKNGDMVHIGSSKRM
jgi:hypothetical protein